MMCLNLPKKLCCEDPTLALLETLISPVAVAVCRMEVALTLNDVAKREMDYYLSILQETWSKFEETNAWWQSHQVVEKIPCMAQVVGALLGLCHLVVGWSVTLGH
jgi:hypothetical protein